MPSHLPRQQMSQVKPYGQLLQKDKSFVITHQRLREQTGGVKCWLQLLHSVVFGRRDNEGLLRSSYFILRDNLLTL